MSNVMRRGGNTLAKNHSRVTAEQVGLPALKKRNDSINPEAKLTSAQQDSSQVNQAWMRPLSSSDPSVATPKQRREAQMLDLILS